MTWNAPSRSSAPRISIGSICTPSVVAARWATRSSLSGRSGFDRNATREIRGAISLSRHLFHARSASAAFIKMPKQIRLAPVLARAELLSQYQARLRHRTGLLIRPCRFSPAHPLSHSDCFGDLVPSFMHMNIIIVHGRSATRGGNPAAANQFQFSTTSATIPTPSRRYSTKRCRAKYLVTLLGNRPAAPADVALC
jgi:hypothetical protein